MQGNLSKDLEEMSERKAPFIDYFNKMVEIVDNVEGYPRVILLFKVALSIREIGYQEGKRAVLNALLAAQ